MWNRVGNVAWIVALFLLGLGCNRSVSEKAPDEAASAQMPTSRVSDDSRAEPLTTSEPVDVRLLTSEGEIVLRLYPDKAPRTVRNFIENYLEDGLYAETIFHHVEAGRMIIGGGYAADLTPRPAKVPVFNEAENGLSNRRGTIAMVREADSAHSATSQFFINLADNRDLDYQGQTTDEGYGYCVFGEVIRGLEVADRIGKRTTKVVEPFASLPSDPVILTEATVLR